MLMKKFFAGFILCWSIILLVGCNHQNVEKENLNLVVESSSSSKADAEEKVSLAEVAGSVGVSNNENSSETVHAIEETSGFDASEESPEREIKDIYVGEYNDYDVDEPNLQIQKNVDGTYTIQIGIFRLALLNDGIGILTEKGIEFTATAPNGEELTGIIVVEGDIAIVTFTNEVWATYSSINEYRYYKASEIPNIDVLDYMEP